MIPICIVYMSHLEAIVVKEALCKMNPDYSPYLRIVEYQKGTAIQWYESGPYWPEVPDGKGMFDPISNKENV